MTCNFHEKRSVCPFWREFEASVTILTTFTLTNAILPKRARHDLKRAFCTIFMKSAPFSRFEDNFRPVWLFWELWRSKMRFGQNVLRTTWKERFVQFSWKAHCFSVLKRLWGEFHDFENFDSKKCGLAKLCCAWPKKKGFVQFSWKAHCFAFLERLWGQCDDFDNFDAHKFYLAKTFYACSEKERFVQFLWIAHCFPVLARISGQCDYFKNFDAHKFDLAKTCCAWPEKSVLYNFHEKRTVFPFWREFTASVTILTTLTLKNTI